MLRRKRGVNSYYHYDGLGSTRQLTDESETVTAGYTYDGFGNVIASTGTSDNVYGFTGEQQFEEADNLVFLRARYYDPSIGRFISRDPIGYKGGLNLYRYVENNPINMIDPTGTSLDCIKCFFDTRKVAKECGRKARHYCDDDPRCTCPAGDCDECYREAAEFRKKCLKEGVKKLESCIKCAGGSYG